MVGLLIDTFSCLHLLWTAKAEAFSRARIERRVAYPDPRALVCLRTDLDLTGHLALSAGAPLVLTEFALGLVFPLYYASMTQVLKGVSWPPRRQPLDLQQQ